MDLTEEDEALKVRPAWVAQQRPGVRPFSGFDAPDQTAGTGTGLQGLKTVRENPAAAGGQVTSLCFHITNVPCPLRFFGDDVAYRQFNRPRPNRLERSVQRLGSVVCKTARGDTTYSASRPKETSHDRVTEKVVRSKCAGVDRIARRM